MDPSGDRTAPDDGIARIRAEIVAARVRLVGTLDALRYKADLPARLGDSVGTGASRFIAHVIDGLTSSESEGTREDPIADPGPDALDVAREVDQGAG
jgi:Protein of unknown function (DUF3618)